VRPKSFCVFLGLVGLALGFSLGNIGFGRYGELHRMFVLVDLRLLYTFMGAVALCLVGFFLLLRKRGIGPNPYHRGIVPGSLLFGLGWALCGACPAVALVQLGEGRLCALLTLVALLAGNWVYPLVHRRFFKFDPGSCGG